MANPATNPAKQALRRRIRALFETPPDPASSASITAALAGVLDPGHLVRPLATFAPLHDEPDLLGLLRRFPRACWLFPRVVAGALQLHAVGNPADLIRRTMGIREPRPGLPAVDPAAVGVFLCPGRAFDPTGGRLGRGGGFYDRLLAARAPGSLVIGVAFEAQLVERVPIEPHDARVDLVVTERRVIRAAGP